MSWQLLPQLGCAVHCCQPITGLRALPAATMLLSSALAAARHDTFTPPPFARWLHADGRADRASGSSSSGSGNGGNSTEDAHAKRAASSAHATASNKLRFLPFQVSRQHALDAALKYHREVRHFEACCFLSSNAQGARCLGAHSMMMCASLFCCCLKSC